MDTRSISFNKEDGMIESPAIHDEQYGNARCYRLIAPFNSTPTLLTISIILKAAVEREKAVQAIDVHRELKNCVVTLWVMSQF